MGGVLRRVGGAAAALDNRHGRPPIDRPPPPHLVPNSPSPGFGGIGGILRWKVDFLALADAEAIDAIRATRTAAGAGGAGGAHGAVADGGDDDDDEDGGRGGYEGEGDYGDLGAPTKTTFGEEVRAQ